MRVHNLYSDKKYDLKEKEHIVYCSELYGRYANRKLIDEIEEFGDISEELGRNDIGISRGINEEDFEYEYKLSLKLRKKVMRLFKKYKKVFAERMN